MKKNLLTLKALSVLLGVFLFLQAHAQEKVISGTIVTEKGESVPGANVVIEGTTIGVSTDIDGKFSIKVVDPKASLIISSIGYETQKVKTEGVTSLNIILKEEVTGLDQVIVVGYGTQKKSLVTGAIAKVDGSDIVKESSLKVTQAIQGKTAGVFISSNSGQPGEFVSVRIRGAGSNKNNEPLYVVDGMPLDGYGIDYLNSSDIESIEVLKDAASAAIYGARAANGVILITTKQGKKNEKFTVTYDSYYAIQNPWKKMGVLNAQEYMDIMNEASLNSGTKPDKIPYPQARRDTLKWNTDWQDEMFYYNAPKVSHVVTFSGGTEKSVFSSSLSYNKQDGIVAKGHSNYERLTFRINASHEFGMLTFGSNVNLSQIKSTGVGANSYSDGSSLAQALNLPPIVPVKYDNGKWATPADDGFKLGMQEISNPVALLSYRNRLTNTRKLVGNVFADFDFEKLAPIFKGLHFKTTYNTEFAIVNERTFTPLYYLDPTHKTVSNSMTDQDDLYTTWNIDNILTYTKSLGDNNFTLLFGHSAYRKYHEYMKGEKTDLIFDDFDHAYFGTPAATGQLEGSYDNHTLLSYFGRLDYDYRNKYMLTAILRKDGSSRFGPANKFGYFPSVSAGWVISRENFFPQTDIINFLKLRLSWGQNGNEIPDDFRYTSVMSTDQRYYFGIDQTQYNGMQPSLIPTPGLKWETSEQKNIAIDFGFLKNKLTLTLDFYSKITKDWLLTPPKPNLVGNNVAQSNGGKVENKGVEMELGFKSKVGGLNIDIKVTGGYNVNEVLAIDNAEHVLPGSGGGFGQSNITRAEEGEPIGFFWAYKTNGIFQTQEQVDNYTFTDSLGKTKKLQPGAKPGDVIFVDVNNDGTFDDKDRVKVGDPNPDFTGGLSVSLDWKGIDFNMFWYVALGQQNWMVTRRYDQTASSYLKELTDNRWTVEGSSNKYPRVLMTDPNKVGGINGNWQTPSDLYIYDASYARLKNITLGYTLPKKLTSFARISRIRIYVSAENLITITKYPGFDPEIGGAILENGVDRGIYPQAKTFLAGLNVTF